MSIRLRFTLLYTVILALMLAVFGGVLYGMQSHDMLDLIRNDLTMGANKLAEAIIRSGSPLPPPDAPPMPPVTFDQFSSQQEFKRFPEQDIARILDANGKLVASPFGKSGEALPLSADGLKELQAQRAWWQIDSVSGEPMLIYSRPVIINNKVEYIVQMARSLSEREHALQALTTTLLIAGLLTILIAFGIGWVLAGITLNPIQRITHTAKAIGEERDFSRRVDYSGPLDEVGLLANTFNAMLARLQDAFQKTEHALEMQRNFVADVSHELRTPLTTLRGNLGLLSHESVPAEEQQDILNDMVDESDRLIRLVNDLLKLARADAGRNLVKEPVDLSTLMAEACQQACQLDTARNIQVKVEPGLQIIGDRDALKQVLLIALDNALKYSGDDILVNARKINARVEIRVQDHGLGIAPEDLQQIFNRFYRGEENITPGFGLGLPIAKSLVEAQGGAITMESVVGQGSVLIISFPAAM